MLPINRGYLAGVQGTTIYEYYFPKNFNGYRYFSAFNVPYIERSF